MEELETDDLRVPVLQAERDAAEMEAERLHEDVERMEASWKIEDRERTYQELTKGE